MPTFGRCVENTENCSPSEGGIGTMCRPTWLQYAPGAMAFQPTFGRCVENVGNCSPSEGGIGTMYRQTGLQYAPGAVAFLSTFGRCVENVGNMLTFGRWNRHDVSANVATICSRGGGVSAHLRKVCEKRGKHAHLRKVESARCIGKQGYNMLPGRWRFYPPSEGVWKTRKTAHLPKVEIRNRQSARDSTGSVLTV